MVLKMCSSIIILVFVLIFHRQCESVNVSESVVNRDVTKREANAKPEVDSNFYPEWVPFKKNLEDIGELVPVKQKPKKRLALPVKFVLKRAANAADNLEYVDNFDGGSEDDNDDQYEKKEWSDLYRTADEVIKPRPVKEKPKPAKHKGTTVKNRRSSENEDLEQMEPPMKVEEDRKLNEKDGDEIKSNIKEVEDTKLDDEEEDDVKKSDAKEEEEKKSYTKQEEDKKSDAKVEDNNSAEDENTKTTEKESEEEELSEAEKEEKKRQEEEEKAKAQAQKEKVLGEVDELKDRHAQEQRLINEKSRLEDGEFQFLANSEKKFSKYRKRNRHNRYEDYVEPINKIYDKYAVHTSPKDTFSIQKIDVTTQRSQRKGHRRRKNKKVTTQSTKKPIYKLPKFLGYTNDDADYNEKNISSTKAYSTKSEPTTHKHYTPTRINTDTTIAIPSQTERYTATTGFEKETTTATSELESTTPTETTTDFKSQTHTEKSESEEISDTPKKPVYGKKRKLNRKIKLRLTTTPATDTHVAETIEDKASTAAGDVTSISNVLPTALEAASETDAVAAPSENQKKEGDGNHEYKKGGGKEHHSEEHADHEEHGKKAYEAHHETKKTAKGHHDKEDHKGSYDDEGGHDKYHHKEDNHYGSHHHEEAGKKHAKYEESGKHSKGHSTKGSHNVHKKDEYEKKVEFFEEEGDSGEEEKHGVYKREKEHGSGGHYKHGELKGAYKDHSKGQAGHFAKGGHVDGHKGHKVAAGHDSHGKHGHGHHHKKHGEGGKQWVYHHGYPAKTANLVVIDRRLDRFNRGPAVFG